jgi:hypothetical protein
MYTTLQKPRIFHQCFFIEIQNFWWTHFFAKKSSQPTYEQLHQLVFRRKTGGTSA